MHFSKPAVVTLNKSLCISAQKYLTVDMSPGGREVVIGRIRPLRAYCVPVHLCPWPRMLITILLDKCHYIHFTKEKSNTRAITHTVTPPDMIPNALLILTNLTLTVNLGARFYDYLHFTQEKNETVW